MLPSDFFYTSASEEVSDAYIKSNLYFLLMYSIRDPGIDDVHVMIPYGLWSWH